jgi:mono/diheme cytochrome c family protein
VRARPLACVSRLRRVLPAALLATTFVLAATACGTGGISQKGDVTRGKQLFVQGAAGQQSCGSCHTLADAGTLGKIGPDLDQAFAADRNQGFSDSTITQVVADQIKFAACTEPATGEVVTKSKVLADLIRAGSCMPRNLVRGADVAAVAAYVASVAGKPVVGAGGKITSTNGKDIFMTAGCTGCHTLKDAGSTGTIGPNLDQKKPPKSLVIARVTNGRRAMPSFKSKLTKQQIDAVAAYVSSVAGK